MRRKMLFLSGILGLLVTNLGILVSKALEASQAEATSVGFSDAAGKFIGAGLAVGLAGFGSSVGMGNAASAAIGAISEDKDLFGSALIFVVLIEAVAIYGLLIALLLIFAGG